MSDGGATEQLVSFAVGYRLDRRDDDLIMAATGLLADYVAVAIAGLSGPVAGAVHNRVSGGSGRSTAIGAQARSSAHDAAMINGMLAHSLEFDDTTLRPIGHPSCTILPAIIALAEREGLTGHDLLEAYVVGLEVHARLGQAQSGNWDSSDNWLPLGSIGQVGGAAAAARLLGLSAEQTRQCIAISAHLGGQLSVSVGTAAKAVGAGAAAWAAVQSADLARLGISGATAVIERPRGFADAFFGAGGHQLDAALSALGRPHHLLEQGIAVKKYPAVFACQWPNDALRQLMQTGRLNAGDIDDIELFRPDAGAFCDCPEPASPEEARSSFEFNLAAIALTGAAGLDAFTEDRLRNPEQLAMQRRVRVRSHSAGTEFRQTWRYLVRVRTRSGDVLEHWVRYPSGHPKLPLSPDEAQAKFRECTKGHLPSGVSEQLATAIRELDRQPSLDDFGKLLRAAR